MTINLKTLVVDRKGAQITQQRVVEIEGKQKLEVAPVWLSDSVAEAFEKHEDRSVPYRKLMAWAIELDKTGSVEIKQEDMQLFISVVESSALLPFVKFQTMAIIEVAQNGN
jgi:hypothetical protein